jgi:amino acid adenylation domain-containing protein
MTNTLDFISEIITEVKDIAASITDAEQQQLLIDFNDTAFPYPTDKTLIDLFAAQVTERADAVALTVQGRSFSYRELNERSNQLAAYLSKQYSIKADDLVALKLPRTEWMIIAMLGILKSGAAYLPIDPDYPEERIAYMLEDSNCKVLLDESEIKKFQTLADGHATGNLNTFIQPADLSYVIYTSGSTGKPKGVMVTHGNVVAFIQNMKHTFQFHKAVIIGCTTNYTFDISVLEIVGGLTCGLQLCLLADPDPQIILEHISSKKITALQVTPSRLTQLLDSDAESLSVLGKLDYLLIGGEALSPAHYKRLKTLRSTKVIQVYGPTEATIWSTSLDIVSSEAVSIGTPLLNEEIYVLNEQQELVPVGTNGEICIGGSGVARGYLNKPELTAERFVKHPFKEEGRIYKTGDLGRWNAAGMLEFIGRKDNQVKIRGYRIELGEIEEALQQHSQITATAVICRSSTAGEQELIAYLVSKANLSVTELRTYLSHTLPLYMLPSYFVVLEKMPLNSSGKLDRKKLPDPQGICLTTNTAYIAPRTTIEEKLVSIIQDLLDKDKIGVSDNFFEIGGHSLKANRLIMRIKKEYKVEIDFETFFQSPTIEAVADKIANDNWLQASLMDDDSDEILI